MTRTDFERFKEEKKVALAECLRGRLSYEHIPDMPSVDGPDSLKEQYYWFMHGIANPPEDDIDWEGLEKELRAYSDEVCAEWMKRKRAEDRAEAIRAGRL